MRPPEFAPFFGRPTETIKVDQGRVANDTTTKQTLHAWNLPAHRPEIRVATIGSFGGVALHQGSPTARVIVFQALIEVEYLGLCDSPFYRRPNMLRMLILFIAVVAALFLVDAQRAQARHLSYGNPGKYFNVHGVTYGSMKWERERGNRRALFQRSRRGFFRRR